MWLCLRRLKEEGKEGAEFGQYLYEIYNHDVELRVSQAGVRIQFLHVNLYNYEYTNIVKTPENFKALEAIEFV